MPKRIKYPGLRSHSWKTAGGEKRTAYYFESPKSGKRHEEPLGTDYAQALIRWHELAFDRPREAGTLKEAFDAWEREVLPGYEKPSTRRDYLLSLTQLRASMSSARWEDIGFPDLKEYLRTRTAKTRANRELAVLQLVWNWARGVRPPLTTLPYPAAGMAKSKWKNKEHAREVEWTPAMFAALYEAAEPALRDCMDVMSAAGLRVRDVLKAQLTDIRGDALVFRASKTDKRGDIELPLSPVLKALIERRKASKAPHFKLLTRGNVEVTERWLMDAWARARAKAAKDCPEVSGLILRDVRKYAAQLAPSLAEAQALMQHGSAATTQRHYRSAEKVRPVR